LEAEYERAREEGDDQALRNLREELARRRQTPRVTNLRGLIEGDAGSNHTEDRPTSSTEQGVRNASAPPVGNEHRDRSDRSRPNQSTPRSTSRARRRGGSPPSFRPTPQQEQATEAFRTGAALKINAYAGSGKTSTLQLLAHSTSRQGQYLAFNRKIVFDSRDKFPSQVDCATTHAVAFRSLRGQHTTDQLTGKLTANELVEILKLNNWRVDRNHVLVARSQAFLILSTIRRFCQSAERELLLQHVPRHGSLKAAPDAVIREVAEVALKGAQHVWARMLLADDPLPLGHDGYLKVWALSRPRLPVDYILLDEAQDTNPVVLDVLTDQDAQMVYVGDKYQQIYEWRGAINAMDEAPAKHMVHLTTSFRFGGEIADAANRVLRKLEATERLIGNPGLHSRIGSAPNGTVLARTNATTITAIIEALDEGKRPHLVGGTDDLMGMLRGVRDLKDGQPSAVPEFFGFENWQQIVEFVRSGEGEELLTFVNLVEARGENQLMWALNRVVDEDECDFAVSTAHKAKGREWDEVRLMDDFLKSFPRKNENNPSATEIDPGELRLLYVALTRAKHKMEVPSSVIEFLKTGALPPVERPPPPQSRSTGTRKATADDEAPPPPAWTPPTNWGQSKEAAETKSQEATVKARTAPPPLPKQTSRPPFAKKRGLLRRLLGG